MEKEIKIKLTAIEECIAEFKANCRKNVFETLNILLKDYPTHTDDIQAKFKAICQKYGIDFYAELRVDANDIAEYVEQNVKPIEP